MTSVHNKRRRSQQNRCGASLIEIAIASIMLAGITLAALKALPDMRDSQLETADLVRAHELARALMTEIMQQPYEEQFESVVFGPEPSEPTNPKTRTNFDDVDDYKDWNKDEDLPLQDKDGTPLNIGSGWVRKADVEYVKNNQTNTATGGNQGVKRVVVSVSRDSKDLAMVVGTMSKHWQAPPYD